MAIAPSAIGGNQKPLRALVAFRSHSLPPTPDRLDGKFSRVPTDSHRTPSLIGGDIASAVGTGLAELLVGEVMRIHFHRLPLGSVFSANIRLFAECFLLFGIHGDGRTSAATASAHATRDMLKLSVAVRMIGS